jgi:signal transduction histidine kinase
MLHHYFRFLPGRITVGVFLLIYFCPTVFYAQSNQYVLNQYNSENGLPQNTVKAIKFDQSGFCWLATEMGIVRFDNRNFKPYGGDLVKGLANERISTMVTDTSGNILIQTINYKNFKISGSSSLHSSVPVLTGKDFNFVSTGYIIRSTQLDSLWESIRSKKSIPVLKQPGALKNGDIYLFFGDEAYFIRNTSITPLEPYETEPVGNLILHDQYYLQLWKDNQVKIWHNGVGQTRHVEGDIVTNKDYQEGQFKTLWCKEGAFVYAGGSLYELVYLNGRINSTCIVNNLNIELPLCIAYRPDIKTYFIGTGTQGFFTIKLSDFMYPDIPKESGAENYYTIAKTSKNEIVVNNALVSADNSTRFVALNNQDSRASYTDATDNVYYESNFTLSRYHSRTGIIDRELLVLDNRLLDIEPDIKDGTLLLCTHTSLYKITTDGHLIWQKKFPPDMNATGLLPLSQEEYLLSTSVGLKWYNPIKHAITKTILDSFHIRTVYRDKENRLWIGTDGKGSFLYDKNKLHRLPDGPRGAFQSIHSFIEDAGYFWLPTNNGLYKVAINTFAGFATGTANTVFWFTFNQGNGLRTTEFNGGANPNFQWLQDGALVLPSINGLVKFYPHKLQPDFPHEKIFIDEVTIDGQTIDLSNSQGKIKLKPTFQVLNIKVTCPYFGNNENLKLEYKIGTGEGQWVPVPSSGIISINRLPANNYNLTIRKAGSDHTTPNGHITLKVIVTPFFYQTIWFFLGILLLIICCGYWYSRRRLAKLEKEKLKIEKIVDLRTTELSTAVQQLEHSETALKKSNEVKEQIIATVLHDLKSPLFSMRVTGKALVKNWDDNSEENLNQVKGLNQLIGELSRFTDQFFSWAASQQEHFKVEKTHFPLQDLFTDMEAFFKEILLVNHNKIYIPATGVTCFTDRNILILVLRNLVDNANKNTENGSIRMEASDIPNGFKIQVSDTGKGLNAFQIENFLNKDKAVKNGRMGSVIILEMLSTINGELFVQSETGKGAVFTIHIYSSKQE